MWQEADRRYTGDMKIMTVSAASMAFRMALRGNGAPFFSGFSTCGD
jgi:hypothetical protein